MEKQNFIEKLKKWFKGNSILKVIIFWLLPTFAVIILAPMFWPELKFLVHIKQNFSIYSVLSILVGLIIELINIEKRTRKNWDTHLSQDKQQIKEILGGSQIVLKIDIKPFIITHLNFVMDFTDKLNSQGDIYALDATEPWEWWSNSMLGYLAILSKWVSKYDKKIHRYFLVSPDDLLAEPKVKLIQLHYLFGFDTYVLLKNVYEKFVKNSSKTLIKEKREFLIWVKKENENDNNAEPIPIEVCDIMLGNDRKIYGYESFWNVDDSEIDKRNIKVGKSQMPISELPNKFKLIIKPEDAIDYFDFIDGIDVELCSDFTDVAKAKGKAIKINIGKNLSALESILAEYIAVNK